MGTNTIRRLALDGVLMALFLVLGMVRVRAGFVEIGFGTIVITLAAFALSPIDALLIGGIGEFISQVFFSGYGLTPTTPLWVLPVALRGLFLGLIALIYKRKGDTITKHIVPCFLSIMGVALFISGLDTGILYLDGLIMNYPVSYTAAQTIIRFATSQLNAIICGILVIPLYKAVMFMLPNEEVKSGGKETEEE